MPLKKYRLGSLIGSGSFGEVYIATDTSANRLVAVKLQRTNQKDSQLIHENMIYRITKEGKGIPTIYWFGKETNYYILVMQYLGPSIEVLFHKQNKRFSLRTTLEIGVQLLNRLEFIHSKGVIHRDIKPDNLLVGRNNDRDTIFLVDFGLATTYRDLKTMEHRKFRKRTEFVGTVAFSSLNSHLHHKQSRRDDIESAAYVLLYLSMGKLPWQKPCNIIKMKENVTEMSFNNEVPSEIITIIKYCRSLTYQEMPKYQFLRNILLNSLNSTHISEGENIFDWQEDRNNLDTFAMPLPHHVRRYNSIAKGSKTD